MCSNEPNSPVTWLDNKMVTLLLTNIQPNETTTKDKDGSRIEIECSSALSLYSENIEGVDHSD